MATAKAFLKNYRQSPRKVGLIADFIRGKEVNKALHSLRLLNKRASDPVSDLIKSARANAKNLNLDPDTLFIKEINVNKGSILYRRKPRARGRAVLVRKRTSHVSLVLAEKGQSDVKAETLNPGGNQSSNPEKVKKETS